MSHGKIFSFDHIDCLHGSDPNETDKTMVSFDFRLALKEIYYDTDASSVNLATNLYQFIFFKRFRGLNAIKVRNLTRKSFIIQL